MVSFLYLVIPSLSDRRIVLGVPIITQSDPGTENYGVANAHTQIRHRLDPNLTNTLQHRFARGHNNILSEIKWSVFRRDFAPGFEDILQDGVSHGWYNINDPLEKYMLSTSLISLAHYSRCILGSFSVGLPFHGSRQRSTNGLVSRTSQHPEQCGTSLCHAAFLN